MEFVHGSGCTACGHTGYRGRIGIAELLRLTPGMKQMVRDRASEAELAAAAAASGMRSLRDDAVAKIRGGLTTVEEVLRVIRIDDEGAEIGSPKRRIAEAHSLERS
jgi:type II secretory ATPase GspE/PulE/Tfp pilus assembly ATPase PilB-like protein